MGSTARIHPTLRLASGTAAGIWRSFHWLHRGCCNEPAGEGSAWFRQGGWEGGLSGASVLWQPSTAISAVASTEQSLVADFVVPLGPPTLCDKEKGELRKLLLCGKQIRFL